MPKRPDTDGLGTIPPQILFHTKTIRLVSFPFALPAAYTKGADALKRSKSTYQRRRISFSVYDFNHLVRQIETMVKAGAEINPEDFYPEV